MVRVLGALIAAWALTACGGDVQRTMEFVVPEGTWAAVTAGEDIEIMPEVVELEVGDQLRIVNNDVETHILGPYTVRPGETFEVIYTVPGEYPGTCTANTAKSTVIKIT